MLVNQVTDEKVINLTISDIKMIAHICQQLAEISMSDLIDALQISNFER